MPEVAGGAAYLVDPNSIEDMTSAMSEVLQNRILREEMIEKGLELVHPYTWENVSERYLELYQEIIESY
jgi:glycosyltransferase involved in cell wall biosynthesis